MQALFVVSKENMIRHTILKLQLAESIIYFNSKLSNQEDFILRTQIYALLLSNDCFSGE